MIFEDNEVSFNDNTDYSTAVDAWMSSAIVARYNTLTNSRFAFHGSCHGGPYNTEVYGNTISSPATNNYRNIHHQGSGEIIVFNNRIAGGHIALLHYRSDSAVMPNGSCSKAGICDGTQAGTWPDGNRSPISTYRGYPCWHQPARDGSLHLRPIYRWDNVNTANNMIARVNIETDGYTSLHLQANRDYYEAVSASAQTSTDNPFDGTVDMGFGTLANRPTTCNANTSESGGGVGYWATDTQTLYRCSAPNTWVVHYRPYSYPHPLVKGDDGGIPAAPTGFHIVVN